MSNDSNLKLSSLSRHADRWLLGAAAVAAVVSCWGVLARLLAAWGSDPDYSHGFLVPCFFIYYGWIHRIELKSGFEAKQPLVTLVLGAGLILLGAALQITAIGYRLGALAGLSLIPLAAGALLVLCGTTAFRRMLPACFFLVFMIPLPNGVLSLVRAQLQTIATSISVFTLQTIGLPAISRGNIIMLPNAEVGVAEACSGLRMVITLAAMVTAVCMLIDRTRIEKTVLLAAIIPLAVFVNSGRIVSASLTAQYVPVYTQSVHDLAGWLMMIVACGGIWLLLLFLSKLFIVDFKTPLG